MPARSPLPRRCVLVARQGGMSLAVGLTAGPGLASSRCPSAPAGQLGARSGHTAVGYFRHACRAACPTFLTSIHGTKFCGLSLEIALGVHRRMRPWESFGRASAVAHYRFSRVTH
eukprot:355508-Chlamydomonas_euryale.AAC.11